MFDTGKVAKNIKEARVKKNMTQMNLADEMGVSYQAVSNWERGNSMPDIAKLPELCKILDIRFEELVGEESGTADTVKKMMENEHAEVSLEELAELGPMVEPERLEQAVSEEIEAQKPILFSTVIQLAPFLDQKTLNEMARRIADADLNKLAPLAPFVSGQTLDELAVERVGKESITPSDIIGLAPFLSEEAVGHIVDELVKAGEIDGLAGLAPFMSKGKLSDIVGKFTDVVFAHEEKGGRTRDKGGMRRPDGKDASDLSDMEKLLEELDEDEIAELAFRKLEAGEPVEAFLDYMDEDDVGELAKAALERGLPIEVYLDYMDEDTVKELLLDVWRNQRDKT